MPLVLPPDDVTAQAIKGLRGDGGMQHIVNWLERAVTKKDIENRTITDGVPLRMGQGAAAALAEVIGHLQGKTVSAGVLEDTREGLPANQTPIRRGP